MRTAMVFVFALLLGALGVITGLHVVDARMAPCRCVACEEV